MNGNQEVNAALDSEREAFQRRARVMSERSGNAQRQPVSRPQLPQPAKALKKIKGKDSRK